MPWPIAPALPSVGVPHLVLAETFAENPRRLAIAEKTARVVRDRGEAAFIPSVFRVAPLRLRHPEHP